jgi:hypothetical protein
MAMARHTRDAKQYATARRRCHVKAQERLDRDRRQAQHAAGHSNRPSMTCGCLKPL